MKSNKDKIVTKTANKIIIKMSKVNEALSPEDVIELKYLIDKIEKFDKR